MQLLRVMRGAITNKSGEHMYFPKLKCEVRDNNDVNHHVLRPEKMLKFNMKSL